ARSQRSAFVTWSDRASGLWSAALATTSRLLAAIIDPRAENQDRSLSPSVIATRTDFQRSPSDSATAGRKECASTAKTISAAANGLSLLGRPAMLSTVSLNAPVANIALAAKLGLDRALRISLRGAAKTRRTPRAAEPMTISV